MLRLILMFGFNSLLSAAAVALTVTRSLELVERIEQALNNPRRNGHVAALCETALKAGFGLLICGALTWRLARHVPFG